MFVDAAAIIAILSEEEEAERCSQAIQAVSERMTSPIAVWEAVVALARPDKFDRGRRARSASCKRLSGAAADCGPRSAGSPGCAVAFT